MEGRSNPAGLREKEVALMRRIITVVVVALVMAAMMLAMAIPAFGAPNPNSAAGECGPPGQSHSEAAKEEGSAVEAWGEPPGQSVIVECAPGTRGEDEEPI
jgi:hypothetical protein